MTNDQLLNQKVLQRTTDLLYSKVQQLVNTILPVPAVVGVAFWSKVPHILLIVWLALSFAVSLFRYFLSWKYKQLPEHHSAHQLWRLRFVYSSLASGLLWGAAGVVFFDVAAGLQMILLYGAIIGLSAGCVVVASYTLEAYFAFTVPAMGMCAINFLFFSEFDSVALGAMFVALFLIMTKAAFNQQQDTKQATLLLFENMDLIEQLKRQKAIAEKADADKSRFLAAASHDLRQPLHAMQLYISSVNPKVGMVKQPQVWLGLQRAMASLHALFNSLLDLSRLDAGMLHPTVKEFSLKSLVEGFVGEYITQAHHKGLIFNMPEHDVLVKSDAVLLETIMRNLISNAIRYTDAGKVELFWRVVDVGEDEKRVLLTVKDTGIGISPDYQQEIFNEYFQIDNPERDKNKGLGLGLAIVRRLSSLLKCEISLSSRLGEGTALYLTIPVGNVPEPLHREAVNQGGEGEFLDFEVWIIDNEVIVRDGMHHLLSKWGCRTEVFDGYESALKYWQSRSILPALVIADYRLMGHANGAQTLELLLDAFRVKVPCLIVTGDTSPEMLKEVQAYQFPLLHKPINESRLKVFMRQALRTAQLEV